LSNSAQAASSIFVIQTLKSISVALTSQIPAARGLRTARDGLLLSMSLCRFD
jgi:hypothetical protein